MANADLNARVYVDAEGILVATMRSGSRAEFAPRSLTTTDRSASVSVEQGSASIRMRTGRGMLRLTSRGFSVGSAAVQPYSAAGYRELGQLVKADRALHDSALKLRRATVQTLYGLAASEQAAPTKKVFLHTVQRNKRQATFATRPRGLTCRVESVIEVIEREVEGWITSVFTVAEQLVQCEERCLADFPPLEKPFEFADCGINCGYRATGDLWTSTWGVVDTIAEEVVREVTHCSPDVTRYPSPWGVFDLPAGFIRPAAPTPTMSPVDITRALGPFGPVLRCLTQGAWSLTTLRDINVDVPGVDAVPLGVTVCLNRACTDVLKGAVTGAALVALLPELVALFLSEGINGVLVAMGLGLAAIPVVAGATVGEILLVALLVLGAHATIVAGQLVTLDLLGLAPNGVCLTYPALPGLVTGVLNPVVGMVVLANTPVIVTPQ